MSKRESFIDRYQLWPFYRKLKYCEETMAEMEDTDRLIREHHNPFKDEDLQVSRNERSRDGLKYRLIEKPRYLKGKELMIKRGFDLDDLDLVIDLLCRGYKLPSNFKNHKLKENMRGFMECHIGYDWLLVYRYDHDELILYAVDTGSHKDVFGH